MNDSNPYASGSAGHSKTGAPPSSGEQSWWSATGALVLVGLSIPLIALAFFMNDKMAVLLIIPPLAGTVCCLVGTHLRAWRGMVLGALVGLLVGYLKRNEFNFGMGRSIEVEIWTITLGAYCLGYLGSMIATFSLRHTKAGLASIAAIVLSSILVVLGMIVLG